MTFSKRTLRSIVIGLVVATLPMVALANDTFSDVPTDYFAHGQINNIAGAGVTAGCGAGTFCPEQAVTRGQMAIFVNRAAPKIGFDEATAVALPAATATPVVGVLIAGNGGTGAINMVKVDATFTNTGANPAVFSITDGTDSSRALTVAAGASGALTWATEMAADADVTFSLSANSTIGSTASGELTAIQGLFGPDGGNALDTTP